MKQIFTVLALLLVLNSFAQTKNPNLVGENITIESTVLKASKNIQVYLPNDYHESNINYPVVYLLDGQRFFLYGVSLYQSFSAFDTAPDFIVVGITNNEATRMRTFSSDRAEFLDYLKSELIPYVDENYRTSNKRLLFGWAYAGGFGVESFMKFPQLFDGYILSSPYPVESKIDRFSKFLKNNKDLSTFLYYSSYKEENGVREGTTALNKLLDEEKTRLRWYFKDLKGEQHRSTPYTTIYHGILSYFNFYQDLHLSTLDELNKLGGLAYFNDYYQTRHKLYGKDLEPPTFSKYSLLRLAIKAKEFETFKKFHEEFGGDKLTKQLRVSWAFIVAEFYLSNGDKKEARNIFQIILEDNPDSKRAKEGLSKTKI